MFRQKQIDFKNKAVWVNREWQSIILYEGFIKGSTNKSR